MTNIVVVMILVVIIGGAVSYLVHEKINGAVCIGCPAGSQCARKKTDDKESCGADCSCGCSDCHTGR